MFKNAGYLILGLAILALVIAGPLFVIWAWNTLFGSVFAVPYTFWTWLAVLIIGTFIRGDVRFAKK